LRALAEVNHANACAAAERLARVPGVELVTRRFFNEFTLRLPVETRPVVRELADRGIIAEVSLGRLYPDGDGRENALVVAVTETVTAGGYRSLRRRARGGAVMTVNQSGWRPEMHAPRRPARPLHRQRGLMLEEPLIFEIGGTRTTGVDIAPPPHPATALASLAREAPVGCPACPSPRPCATTPGCRARTTRSTSASSRSGRAR
jgi:hypothetical protein